MPVFPSSSRMTCGLVMASLLLFVNVAAWADAQHVDFSGLFIPLENDPPGANPQPKARATPQRRYVNVPPAGILRQFVQFHRAHGEHLEIAFFAEF